MSPPAPRACGDASSQRSAAASTSRGWCCRQLVMEVALGLLIGFVEGWSVGEAVYFSFVTDLTIGYAISCRGRRSRTSKSACPMGRVCCEVP